MGVFRCLIDDSSNVVSVASASLEAARVAAFGSDEELELATAVSELVVNAVRFGGSVEVAIDADPEAGRVMVRVIDEGPDVLGATGIFGDGSGSGTYPVPYERRVPLPGLGMGLGSVRRLVDAVVVKRHRATGTEVQLLKWRRRPALGLVAESSVEPIPPV